MGKRKEKLIRTLSAAALAASVIMPAVGMAGPDKCGKGGCDFPRKTADRVCVGYLNDQLNSGRIMSADPEDVLEATKCLELFEKRLLGTDDNI